MAKNKIEKGVTLIATNTAVEGTVTFEDQLYVNGSISGNVVGQQPAATLVISEEGKVAGEVHVANVVVNGEIDGDVYASERVELGKAARVNGTVYYKLIEMQLGALVDGQLIHRKFTEGGDIVEAVVHPIVQEADAVPDEPASTA